VRALSSAKHYQESRRRSIHSRFAESSTPRFSLYFPGCSLKGTGVAYEESLLALFRLLGIGRRRARDWNCCGATSYMAISEGSAFALAARNLALAQRAGAREADGAVQRLLPRPDEDAGLPEALRLGRPVGARGARAGEPARHQRVKSAIPWRFSTPTSAPRGSSRRSSGRGPAAGSPATTAARPCGPTRRWTIRTGPRGWRNC